MSDGVRGEKSSGGQTRVVFVVHIGYHSSEDNRQTARKAGRQAGFLFMGWSVYCGVNVTTKYAELH
jgi:hypothetical protein